MQQSTKKKLLYVGLTVAVTALLAATFLLVRQTGAPQEPAHKPLATDSTAGHKPYHKYGIPPETYHITHQTVRPGQTLAVLLAGQGFSPEKVHALTLRADSVFDVRKIRSGQTYILYATRDSLPHTEYLVYEVNEKDYVVFDLRGDYRVTTGRKPTEWKQKTVKGTVKSSLWTSMEEHGTSPLLAMVLSDIYGWSIDFFGLQQDDEFRVIYEQEHVEGRGLDNFRVKTASFRHADSTYYAIPFTQEGEELYYNEQGNSLEGAFLKAPLDFYRISSRFSHSRLHPVLKRYRPHHGVDYAAPTGTPVYAIGNGRVIAKSYQAGGAGNYLKIRHNSTYVTTYMHLSRFAKGIKVGSEVKQKEVIGYVGATGIATGPHLDFRVHENGRPINPLHIKSQPKKPISPENREQFTVVKDSLVRALKAM